jgi:PPK2 family polyphosphate:nucleotide phosphotransferase
MSYSDLFRVKPGSAPRLSEIDPDSKGEHEDRASAEAEIAAHAERLRALQYLMYADGERSLLVCLQGLDAAGKDGTIRHVLGAMNPQGTRVHGFKVPSHEEAAHDFLWRAHVHAPAKGEVVVFNRSHYEDVLVVRVHDLVPREVWSKRYDRINDFEENLAEHGTCIVKLYLHVSPDEQLRRFKQRLGDPSRHWKISLADYAERELWPAYVEAYEEALRKTSTDHAPWFVVPANHKWFRDLTVSRIVVEALESLGMKLPAPTVDIDEIRHRYDAAERDEKALEKKVGSKGDR